MAEQAPATADERLPGPAPKLGRNAFLFIILTVFIDILAFAVIIPVFPTLIAELVHGKAVVDAAEVANAAGDKAPLAALLADAIVWSGYITMFYAVLNFLMQPVLGNLSDRFGRRPVLLVSMATLAIDFLIMAFAHTIWVLFLGRMLTGVSGATHATANAYIADTTEPQDRAKAFGMLGAAFGVAFIMGPAIGGLLGQIDPRAPFFAAAALAGVNFLYGYFVLPESLATENRRAFDWKRANAFGSFQRFRKLPQLRWFLLASGLYMFGHWVYPSTFSFFSQIRYGWTPAMTGIALGVVGVGSAIVQGLLIGWFIRKLGADRTALFGLCVTVAATVGYAFAFQGWMMFMLIPIGSLAGVMAPALNQIMSSRVERNAQGELAGANAALNAFGSIFAPLIMTQTLHAFTREGAPVHFAGAAFLLAAVISAAAIIPLVVGLRASPQPPSPPPKREAVEDAGAAQPAQ
jgi:DHA1 family tetracycline resistance protein-like MFS transporter